MGVLKKTMIEFLLVLSVGAALGFGLNPWRGSDRIKLSEDYFPDVTAMVEAARAKAEEAAQNDAIAISEPDEDAATDPEPDINPVPILPKSPEKQTKHADHPYQDMTFDEAADIYADPDTELGVNVFIDARNDEAYAEGHIVGAIQCDRYRLDDYIDEVMEAAMQANKVIVYCNGGQCDDSKHLCGELIQRGIPYGNLFLFSGGWEEWSENMMPYDEGGVE